MKRKRSRHEVSPEAILKQLMLELLYPAVLGAVLLFTLEVVERALSSLRMWRSPNVAFDLITTEKLLLLVATGLFYCCDYAYIILTREFHVKFFAYDCVFLLGLYVTLASLHVRERDANLPPITWRIALVYAAFFIMYRKWDKSELRDTNDAKEQQFYRDVLYWEAWSFWLLVGATVAAVILPNSSLPALLLFVVLMASTYHFFRLVQRKRLFATA